MDYKEIARHLAAPIAAGHLGLHRDDGKSILDYFDDEELLSYVNKLKEKHAGR